MLGEVVSAVTAVTRMTPMVTMAIGGARLCHCRNGVPRTIGNCISEAGSQEPAGYESPAFLRACQFVFEKSTEIETLYQTNLDCHLARTFSWHGLKASTARLPSKRNPEFNRTNYLLLWCGELSLGSLSGSVGEQ